MKTSIPVLVVLGGVLFCTAFSGNAQDGIAYSDLDLPKLETEYVPGKPFKALHASVKAIHKVEIAAQSDGLIRELKAEEGQLVSRDEVLLVIDSQIAAAELAVAQKQQESAEILANQTANLEYSKLSREVAIREYNELVDLYKASSANYNEVRRMHLEAEKSKFSVEMALDEIKKSQLEAAVAAEQVKASKVKLGMYQVKAPYEGVIIERLRDYGEWIRAGEPVFRLVHLNEMKVEAYVRLTNISPNDLYGAKMTITFPNSKKSYQAEVQVVGSEIQHNEVKVRANLSNQKDLNDRWMLSDGMTANVTITLKK
ncbi:MAG: HlyD family efflux transporter periplasmic adaptor subunit [Planctomycetota bacterium]